MSKIKLESNPSGTGTFTIQSPASSTDRTLTLPDGAGEILTTTGDGSNLTNLPLPSNINFDLSALSSNGFGNMKLKYTEVSVTATGWVYLGFCRMSTNCGGALSEVGIPVGFIPGIEYNADFDVANLKVEPWPAASHRYEYKIYCSVTTGGTLGILYLGEA